MTQISTRFFKTRKYFSLKIYLIIMGCFTFVLASKAQTDVIIGNKIQPGIMTEGMRGPLHRTGNPNSNNRYLFSRHFALYPKVNLCQAGLAVGSTISKIAWFKSDIGSAAGATHGFKVYMKNVDKTSSNGGVWNDLINGATKVYDEGAMTIPGGTQGWWELTLATPFVYTGDAIEVYTDWSAGGGPNSSRTRGRIQFSTKFGSVFGPGLSGGTGKNSIFNDADIVGGDFITGGELNTTPEMIDLKLTASGGVPRLEICNNGIDDDCDGQIDEGCPAQYFSRVTGLWSTPSTWARIVVNVGGVVATVPPLVTDLSVEISNPTIVTINTAVTADQLFINAGGTLKVISNGVLTLNNGTGDDLTNQGSLQLQGNGVITGSGNFVNEATVSVNGSNLEPVTTLNKNTGTITFTGNSVSEILNNDGMVSWKSGNLNTSGNGTFTNNASGVFEVSSAGNYGSADIINKGTFRKLISGNTSTFASTVLNAGIIEGVGTLIFNGGINNTGIISPGGSGIGALTFNSSTGLLSATSTLKMNVNSLAGAGIGNDLLARDGNLFLQGKLVVTETGDVPAGNYEIIRLNSGTLSGSFTTVEMPTGYTIQVNGNSVVVTKPIIRFPGSGNALVFNGINSAGETNANNSFNFAIDQDFTIDFWVKVPTANQTDVSFPYNVILEKWGDPWKAHPFSISVGNSTSNYPGKILLTRDNSQDFSGYFGIVSAAAINDGRFHHVAVQKSNTTLQIFIDGLPSGSIADKTTGQTTNTAKLHFGSSEDFSSSFLGELDEVRIWNTALSQDLIRAWMCKKITNVHPSFVNLVNYFPLDQLAGNTSIVDNIGTSNGSLFNAAAYIVSGAAVGEESAYSYAALPSASLTLSNGEKLTATSAPGNLKGIHVYAVNTTPNTTTGIVGVGGNDRYFGVHVVGSATPQYDAVYDYTGNSFVTDETALQLYKRNSNNITTWDLVTATKNTANNTFTFTGQFTEYMLGNVGGVLPVTLLNFTGISQAGKNLLSWKTTNETAFSHFEVDVSNDATNFNTIGKVTAGTNNYAFTHFNPLAGNHFYRLKMVDKDGRFSFSGIIKLVQNQSNKLSVFPNPAKEFITINSGRKQTAVITNTIGKVMSVLQLVNGSQSISTITWAHGIYFIKTTEEVIKLVIQK